MNPDDNWMIFSLAWGVNIESLPFVLRLRVGLILVNLRVRSKERGDKEQEQEGSKSVGKK